MYRKGTDFWDFSQGTVATNRRAGRQVTTPCPETACPRSFPLYIYVRFHGEPVVFIIKNSRLMDEQPDSSQQLMDILLVMDEKQTIQAVSGVKDGELQTKNPLEDNNDFLRVDRHGDMFSNFFSNLWNQLKDPTRFHFFRVPEEEVKRVAADFQETLKNPTPEGEARMRRYEVQPPQQEQRQEQQQRQSPESAPGQEQNPQYKYRVEDIDWGSLAAIGVQREQIEKNGMLDQMLRGFQTDKTVRVHFNFEGLSHSNDSQLSLKPNADGKLTVCSHGILDPDKMQKQFFGYDLTDTDKQMLRQTGNMGHMATVTNRAGEKVEALVSRNLKTNELVSFPVEKVNIPEEKNGHTFTPEETARLKQGEAVVCQFKTRPKEGEEAKSYLAPVQFNAAKMQLEFLFGERGKLAMDEHKQRQKEAVSQEVPTTFRKQQLTEKSRMELEAGGTVKVSGLIDKKGKQYQGYITWKPGEKPQFMFPKEYKTALEEGRVKPAVENEVQVAVNSEGKTVEAAKNLKEALQSAQQKPTGEQQQQQDRKQEQQEEKKQEQKQEQPDKPKRGRGVRR